MDLNGDGNVDILSGSYSRMTQPMAGLFQILYGTDNGTFRKATVLNGTDEKPLIIPGGKLSLTDTICTRPTAVDLNGDGKLDIVSGNFAGSFAFFVGEGKGRFAPKPTMLRTGWTGRLTVPAHSDPFFVDWDGDGDLDLISGSGSGGVFLCTNKGSVKKPKFRKPIALVAAINDYHDGDLRMGDAHLTGPQSSTRVWVDDINGDGKLDLLVGDSVNLSYPAKGLDEKTARAKLAKWKVKEKQVLEASREGQEAKKKFQSDYSKVHKERDKILRTDMTGFVWVIYQKTNGQKANGQK